ncbi:MAG: hypothetical protein ACOX2O_01600 [Bdellovibrionota bacterium]|jgi:hypothetical protein
MKNEDFELTDKQKVLLQRFFDDECVFLTKWAARKLIRNNESARSYIADLQRVNSALCRDFEDVEKNYKVDLWEGVARRIEQENRAAIFLGERKEGTEKRQVSNFWWSFSGVTVTMAAGVVSFMLASQPTPPSFEQDHSPNQPQLFSTPLNGAAPNIANVSFGDTSDNSFQRPLHFADDSAVEVDWIKSDGRVSLIRGRSPKSSIIWIKRNRRNDDPYLEERLLQKKINSVPIMSDDLPITIPGTEGTE